MATLSPEAGAGDDQDLGVMGQAIHRGRGEQRLTGRGSGCIRSGYSGGSASWGRFGIIPGGASHPPLSF